MKNYILIIMAFLSLSANAQGAMMVTDTGSYMYMSKTVANTLQTLEAARKQVAIVEKGLKKLKQVKAVISQGKLVYRIGDNFFQIEKELGMLPYTIDRLKYKGKKNSYSRNLTSILNQIEIIDELFQSSVQSNVLEGNDYDRLDFLFKIYNLSDKILKKARSMKSALQFEEVQ